MFRGTLHPQSRNQDWELKSVEFPQMTENKGVLPLLIRVQSLVCGVSLLGSSSFTICLSFCKPRRWSVRVEEKHIVLRHSYIS